MKLAKYEQQILDHFKATGEVVIPEDVGEEVKLHVTVNHKNGIPPCPSCGKHTHHTDPVQACACDYDPWADGEED